MSQTGEFVGRSTMHKINIYLQLVLAPVCGLCDGFKTSLCESAQGQPLHTHLVKASACA